MKEPKESENNVLPNINKELESVEKNQIDILELKGTITEMKRISRGDQQQT